MVIWDLIKKDLHVEAVRPQANSVLKGPASYKCCCRVRQGLLQRDVAYGQIEKRAVEQRAPIAFDARLYLL